MRTKPVRYFLLTVFFVTSCVTYEPAASSMPPAGSTVGASIDRTRLAERPEPTQASPRPAAPGRPFVASPRLVVSLSGGLGRSGDGRIRGASSWYCRAGVSICTHGYGPGSMVAAAGPRLRAAIGPSWRGRVVTINGLRIRLVDWCQCYKGRANEKLVDLYYAVFVKVGGRVVISW